MTLTKESRTRPRVRLREKFMVELPLKFKSSQVKEITNHDKDSKLENSPFSQLNNGTKLEVIMIITFPLVMKKRVRKYLLSVSTTMPGRSLKKGW
jgi:hypothetical protein